MQDQRLLRLFPPELPAVQRTQHQSAQHLLTHMMRYDNMYAKTLTDLHKKIVRKKTNKKITKVTTNQHGNSGFNLSA